MSDHLDVFFQGHVDAYSHECCCSRGFEIQKMRYPNAGQLRSENPLNRCKMTVRKSDWRIGCYLYGSGSAHCLATD